MKQLLVSSLMIGFLGSTIHSLALLETMVSVQNQDFDVNVEQRSMDSPCFNVGMDYGQHNIGIITALSADDCQTKCEANDRCVMFVYGLEHFQHWCWLKDFVPAFHETKTDMVAGPRYCSECGGIVDSTYSSRGLTSPRFPGDYSNNADCMWLLSFDDGELVELQFNFFNLEESSDCSKDYLQFYNYKTRVWSEKFCGSNIPTPIWSKGMALQVLFHTDETGTSAGFEATVHLLCFDVGTDYLENDIVTTSSDSPRDCQVKCQANDQCVMFVYGTGDHNSNMCWLKGTVPVNNVERNSDRVSGPKYCSECGGTITSSGGMSSPNFPANYALNVECQWDIFIPGGDFVELQFDYFNLESSTDCTKDYVQIYDESSQLWSDKYCGSSLPPPVKSQGKSVKLKFRSDADMTSAGFQATVKPSCFDLGTDYASHDIDVTTASSPEDCQEKCQANDQCVMFIHGSSNHQCWLKSSVSVTHYKNPDRTAGPKYCPGCGGLITGPGGLASPRFPANYPTDVECLWSISVPAWKTIRLQFDYFNLVASPDCVDDYVQIFDDASQTWSQKFCGQSKPATVSSGGERLQLKFRSGSGATSTGFEATVLAAR